MGISKVNSIGVIAGSAIAIFAGVPAASAKDICSVAQSSWKPQGTLVKKLEGQGWKIRKLKVDSGCYEVYGFDGNGKARETHFNPATLEAVADYHTKY